MFIYAITNDVNDKVYIGLYSGKYLNSRWRVHCWDVRNSSNIPLHRAMRKYGIEKFQIMRIWSGQITFDKLRQLERYYIKSFNSLSPNGYNLTEGGDGSFGFRHSPETIAFLKKKVFSAETRKRMSLARSRWKHSDEHRRKIGLASKGNKYHLGIPHSEETREKIIKALTGRKCSEETKRKMSVSAKKFFQIQRGELPATHEEGGKQR